MNVLVYSGPEVFQHSLNHAVTSLRSVLLPHYTVQPITASALKSQPWKPSCALLVLPQSRDAHHDGFASPASKQIQEYVEEGGKCLMFGVRAQLKTRSVGGLGLSGGFKGLTLGTSKDDEVPLRFVDEVRNRRIYFTFSENRETPDSKPSSKILNAFNRDFQDIYDTGLGGLQGFEGSAEVTTLGRFSPMGKDEEEHIAGVKVGVNAGELVLWSPNIEYPLDEEPASSLTGRLDNTPSLEISSKEAARKDLLQKTLKSLGLVLPGDPLFTAPGASVPLSRPLPQLLVSTTHASDKVAEILQKLDKLFDPQLSPQVKVLKDSVDVLHFYPFDQARHEEVLVSYRTVAQPPSESVDQEPKKIIFCSDGQVPQANITPLFDLKAYFDALASARMRHSLNSQSAIGSPWGVGEVLLYGEAVSSTQTLFDNNPLFCSNLPTPFLSLASYQLAGRGRGSNVWLSPSGCLQFSILLRLPLSASPPLPAFHLSKLVFIQYLFALAVVEACRDDTILGEKVGSRIRIKWPNDLYANFGINGKEDLKKIGGILVNTSIQGGMVHIIIGCGLNVLNTPPISSLLQLRNLHQANEQRNAPLQMEQTAAAIMAQFEKMWDVFALKGSFDPFIGLYLKRWLHSDQEVTLTSMTPQMKVRIVGITNDYGLLRTVPQRRTNASSLLGSYASRVDGASDSDTGYVDLQPDGNSFDLMAGLIRTKT